MYVSLESNRHELMSGATRDLRVRRSEIIDTNECVYYRDLKLVDLVGGSENRRAVNEIEWRMY